MRIQVLPVLLLLLLCANDIFGQDRWYSLEKLDPSINSSSTYELRPVVTMDGNTMYFTRQGSPTFDKTLIEDGVDLSKQLNKQQYDQKLCDIYSNLSGKSVTEPHRSDFNQDVWMAENIEDDLTLVHHLKHPINNAFPNSICALGREEEEAIVLNQFPEEGGIKKGFSLIQKNAIGQWSAPKPITIEGLGDIEPDVNLGMSSDGMHILLSIQRHDSYGKSNDLYVCERKGLTTFGRPQHLGPAINSPYHEAAPFLSPDGRTLFFSSNRRGGEGGSDIYFVSRLSSGWQSWSAPRALMTPVNSSSDESHPYFVERSGLLYFSSKRNGTSDIFRVQIAPPNSSVVTLAGNVRSGNSAFPVDAYLIAEPVLGGNFRKVSKTSNGAYKMTLPKGKLYEIDAQAVNYLSSKERVYLNPDYLYFQDYPLDFKLIPTNEGEAIVLDNIQFKQSTAILLKSSWPSLENLSKIMLDNSSIQILVEGHTDNVGLKEQLLQLSNDRAAAIKDYLVLNHDISPDRINTIGRGDLSPLNANATELERSINRRVEVSIINSGRSFLSIASEGSE